MKATSRWCAHRHNTIDIVAVLTKNWHSRKATLHQLQTGEGDRQ